jgi:hypothetical protein
MKRLALVLLAAARLSCEGQDVPAPGEMANVTPPPPPVVAPAKPAKTAPPATADQLAVQRLAQSNQELLDLLKKQQAVLEDIQYDRRLQNRQIQLVEVRLEDTLQQNAALQAKVAELEAAAASSRNASAGAPASADKPLALVAPTPTPPPPPASYLPPPPPPAAPGVEGWHRLFAMSGQDGKTSDVFQIQGSHWRILWHNEDKPGDAYKNTSALFINAFPKDDTIPKKVCSQLGTGGEATDLTGSGQYYLKVEASGGRWEAAVEDFR